MAASLAAGGSSVAAKAQSGAACHRAPSPARTLMCGQGWVGAEKPNYMFVPPIPDSHPAFIDFFEPQV